MKEVLYGDVYFIVNFSMDFLALYLVGKLRHTAAPLWRLVFGGVLGGLYATFALFMPPALEAPLTLLCPFVMAYLAFGGASLWTVLKNGFLLFAVSFAMGGVMTAVYYGVGRLLTSKDIYINGNLEVLYSELPLWVLALVAALAAVIALLFTKYAGKKSGTRSAEVVLTEGGREVKLRALCDSGNLLEEPMSRLPVIVVGKEVMRSLLPSALSPAFFSEELKLDGVSPRHMTKMRFIPISTVGNSCLLRGYVPDYITVNGEKKRACVALDSGDGDFDGFDAILPPSLL